MAAAAASSSFFLHLLIHFYISPIQHGEKSNTKQQQR